MRLFKKSLAVVLAVAMVFSLFTCLGGLFVSAELAEGWTAEYRSAATSLVWTTMVPSGEANVSWTTPWAQIDGESGYVLYARKTSSDDAKERAALTFTAPANATYSVTCPTIQKVGANTKVNLIVTRNDSQVWPTDGTVKQLTSEGATETFPGFKVTLLAGETIRFETWSDDSEGSDSGLLLKPVISSTDAATDTYFGTSVSLLPEAGNAASGFFGMNFYYNNPSGKALYYNIDGDEETLEGTVFSENLYRYQLPLSSTTMAKHITVYFKNDGKTDEVVGWSVQEYGGRLLSQPTLGTISTALKKAITSLLEYGRMAQIYFRVDSTCNHPGYAVCPGDLDHKIEVNGELVYPHVGTYPDADLEKWATIAEDNLVEGLSEFRTNKENIHVWSEGNAQYYAAADGKVNVQVTPDSAKGQQGSETAYLYGTSLVLKSNISLKVYLQGDISGKTIEVTAEGMTAGVDYRVGGLTVYNETKHIYYVEISGICPAKLDAIFNIKVKDGETELTKSGGLDVSAMGYISRVLDTYDGGVGGHGVSNNLRDLLLRLTNLYLNSKAYFEVITIPNGENQSMDGWDPLD